MGLVDRRNSLLEEASLGSPVASALGGRRRSPTAACSAYSHTQLVGKGKPFEAGQVRAGASPPLHATIFFLDMNNFIYCPRCASRLEHKVVFNRTRPCCAKCGFIHFRDPKVAVVAFVTFDDKLLLICRAVDPGRGMWALPGGFMDAGVRPGLTPLGY